MTSVTRLAARSFVAAMLALAFVSTALGTTAFAQFAPPATVVGSIADEAGTVPEGVNVEGYIGDTLCGTKGSTQFVGEGAARVTVYFVDVSSEEDKPGCGKAGAEVRIKIGDRFATQTTQWRAGLIQMDVTFGNVSPAVIPTAAPTATRAPNATGPTAAPNSATPVAEGNQAVGTIPAGSPGAGSPVATLKGGVTSATPAPQQAALTDDGGFPVWGIVLLVLLGVAAIGGGVGYAMSRSRTLDDVDSDDHLPPLE